MKKVISRQSSAIRLIFAFLFFMAIQLYPIPYTLYPIHAQTLSPVPLGEAYGFGWVESLAMGTNILVGPAFALAGTAVTIYFIIGGLRFLLSGGNKDSVSKARDMITHAIIGFILLILSFIVLQFIFQFFGLERFQIISNK